MRRRLAIHALLPLLAPAALAQVEVTEVQRFAAPTSGSGDEFGTLVAVDGDHAVVSSPLRGTAYAFERVGGSWLFRQELVPAAPRFRYGIAVAIDGDWIGVGDDLADDATGQTLVGAVQVFRRAGNAWVYEGAVSSGAGHDLFGISVAISGEWLIAGARNPWDGCRVSFFRRRSAGWEYDQKVFGSCGHRAAIDGELAVAAVFDTSPGSPPGEVHVMELEGDEWSVVQVLRASAPAQSDGFGAALAVDGGRILIASRPPLGAGVVHVFERGPDAWVEVQQLTPPNSSQEDRFGWSLAVEDGFALIGDPHPQPGSNPALKGDAWLFRDLGGIWAPVARFVSSQPDTWDRLGSGVGLTSHGEALVGAAYADGPGLDSGLCFAFELVPGAAYCPGDGSGAPCPCNNPGANGSGCANSGGAGALLAAHGTASLALDDLTFFAEGLVPGCAALLLAGTELVQGGAGAPFGDGLRCVGGTVARLAVERADELGAARFGPLLSAGQGWSAGDVRRFQVLYRDPGSSPCGSGLNLTNGQELQFRP